MNLKSKLNGLFCLSMVVGICQGLGMDEGSWREFRDRIVKLEAAPTLHARVLRHHVENCFGVDEAPAVSEKDLAAIRKNMRPDGSFEGIDYQKKDRSAWDALQHLDNCRTLAIALHVFPEHVLKKYKVRETCLKSFDWWLQKRPVNPNWWNNDVYVPMMLGNISLLLDQQDMTPGRLAAFREIVKKIHPSMTGQNRLWKSWNSFLAGLVERDEERVEKALHALHETIRIAAKGDEGIQPDMSFHQHGSQLYQGNYGRHYLHSAGKLVAVTSGLSCARPEKEVIVQNFLLDGTRWMCWGELLDYSVWGRQISYNDRVQGPDLVHVCRMLSAAGSSRKQEIDALTRSLSVKRGAAPLKEESLLGTRAFPFSDYIVHRAPGFMASVRMSSKRTLVGEECNGDNLKGAYLSDGCMLTYGTGGEYEGIFPVWDWTCIPGTTARRGFLPGFKTWSGKRGGSDFAAVMNAGTAAMTLERFGLKANKSWFFYPDRVVCLGSGISVEPGSHAGKTDNPILTSVEQNLLNEKNGRIARLNGSVTKGVSHGGCLYLFPSDTQLVIEKAERRGSWKDIRSVSQGDPVSKMVFLLAVDHGTQPSGAGYAYQVLPGGGLTGKNSPDALWNGVKIVCNTESVHAVARDGEVRIAFFKPGECKLPNGKILASQIPCLVCVDARGGMTAALPQGDATGKNGTCLLILDGREMRVPLES